MLSPAAQAQGSFSQKVTPYGCTEMDWWGASTKPNSTTARAYTSHNNTICLPNSGLQMSAQVHTAGYASPVYWTSGYEVNAYIYNTSGIAYGAHRLNQYRQAQNDWYRNT